jgi:hypothetical protein
MSAKTPYSEQLDRLFEVYFLELREMSDEEVLDGEDRKTVRERAKARLDRASAEVGRRRLAAARADYTASRQVPARRPPPEVTVAQARAHIARVANSREHLYTLAARKLEEMSDEDLLRLYCQIIELEEANANKNP